MIKYFILLMLVLFTQSLLAEEQGELGPTSSGSANISVIIPERFEIKVKPDGSKVEVKSNTDIKFKKEEQVVNGTKIIILIPE
jgi:hypothetical protein